MSLEIVENRWQSPAAQRDEDILDFDLVSVLSYNEKDPATDWYSWLKRGPASTIPVAAFRLMIFRLSYGTALSPNHNGMNFYSYALKLLEELYKVRQRSGEKSRPVLFLCYSFGSYVVKQALKAARTEPTYSCIPPHVTGILFLGAIHIHNHETSEKTFWRALRVEYPSSSLDNNSRLASYPDAYKHARDICNGFQGIEYATVSLYEEEETILPKKHVFLRGKRAKLVTANLVEIQQDGRTEHQTRGEQVDHLTMSSIPPPGSHHESRVFEGFGALLDICLKRNQPIAQAPFRAENSSAAPPQARRGTIQQRVWAASISTATSTQQHLPCRMIRPYTKNKNYVGPTTTLDGIAQILDPDSNNVDDAQKVYALVGLGGAGKTQTALAYVYHSWDKFKAIVWVQAETRTKLSQSFTDFACDMHLVGSGDDQEHALREVRRWFEQTDMPWLVVFDNADNNSREPDDNNLELLSEYWPTGRSGSVLVTSRDKRVIASFAKNHLELHSMDKGDAIKLLYQTSGVAEGPDNDVQALKIVKRVGCLALAVLSVGWIIQTKSISFGKFLTIYDNHSLIQESEPISSHMYRYSHSLSTVWSLQFEIFDSGTLALLNLVSFLDPDEINEDFLWKSIVDAAAQGGQGKPLFATENDFIRYRAKLTESTLVGWNSDLRVMMMHRLVRETCHLRMDDTAHQLAFERAYSVVFAAWPQLDWHNRRQHTKWPEQQTIISHIVHLGNLYTQYPRLVPSDTFAELLYHGGWYYQERGFYESACQLLRISEQICNTRLRDPELILSYIYGGYGAIGSERNEPEETLDNFQKQYDFLMKALDKELWQRPNVKEALALGGLGQGYAGLDMLPKAEEYYRRCIEAWKEVDGEPTIYRSHLGTCLCFQDKLQEAEEVLTTVIHERERKHGPHDMANFRTALLYYALGNVYQRQRRHDEAFEIRKRCLSIYEVTESDKHHSRADAMYKVAWHLQYNKDYPGAVKRYEEALAIYGNSAEYENEIARTKYMLGLAYNKMGETQTSLQCIDEAEKLGKKIKGNEWIAHGEESFDDLVNFWSR